jgi:sulfur relay (sulfurtransferase) DsrF/TusC family protein
MARVLVVFREGPAQALRARDCLDLALAALAFDHTVRVLFTGEGAELLCGGDRELSANLRALAFHGAEAIGVDAEASVPGDPVLAAQPLDDAARRAWLAAADHVLAC